MSRHCSRREFLRGAAALAGGSILARSARAGTPGLYSPRSTVSLVKGEVRRENVFNALNRIDDQIAPLLAAKKTVLIKPNLVWGDCPVGTTHIDAVGGILDYLRGVRNYRGPVVIAEASADHTGANFSNYKYDQVVNEFSGTFASVSLADMNQEGDDGKYVVHQVVDQDLHVQPVRLAARLFDPDAFIIASAIPKTHDRVVATMSVKNMAMGSPLHSNNQVEWWWEWNDKPKMHDTHRLANVNIFQVAQKLKQFWGVAVIDGYQGMEGNGPTAGTPVDSRVAIASTDFVAADRVGVECMGIDPSWVGYLNYAWKLGLGQFDLSRIDIRGEQPDTVKRVYALHRNVNDELQWLSPFPSCNPSIGRPWRQM